MAQTKTAPVKSVKKATESKVAAKKVAEKKVVKTEKVEATIAAPVNTEKKTGLTIAVYDVKGAASTMSLPAEIFGVKINKTLLAQAVRVYLANQRMGSAFAKTRGEVTGSTRKIYQQKGTGRARHGGIRAPLFVGGGAAHGPRPHDFSLTMPQKMRKLALFSALSSKYKDGGIKVVKGLETVELKTKTMAVVMNKIELAKGKTVMVVVPTEKAKVGNVIKAVRNLTGVVVMPVSQLNAYEVLKTPTILFMQDSIGALKEVKK